MAHGGNFSPRTSSTSLAVAAGQESPAADPQPPCPRTQVHRSISTVYYQCTMNLVRIPTSSYPFHLIGKQRQDKHLSISLIHSLKVHPQALWVDWIFGYGYTDNVFQQETQMLEFKYSQINALCAPCQWSSTTSDSRDNH